MGCGCACFLLTIAAFFPRLVLLFLWLFTPYVSRAFASLVAPLLGLIFLPFSTLMYVILWDPVTGVTGWEWSLMLLAFIIDVGSYSGGAFGRRRRR